MEMHFANKSRMSVQKSHVTLRHNLTNQWTDFAAQHLKCCYGHSEVSRQNLSTKYFCIIATQNGLQHLRSQTADIHLRLLTRSASNLLYLRIIIFSGFS